MLGDGKLDSLYTRLEQFKLNNATNQNELSAILREYSQLLDDYKALKRSHGENGKSMKNGDVESNHKIRNPYVLVLIDGNGYIFNDELVREKEEGGMRAARMLNEVVEKYIRESLPQAQDARVIVRIYADLTNLSKQLAKSKLVGLEKRSLAPFAAAFTRAINLFDFTDALDEEGTKFKLRETFKLAAEDSSCSHILYAACHDSSYLPQLVPYSGLRNKITLVQGAGFNSEFHQFSLNVTQFPTIFRWSSLSSAAPSTAPSSKPSAAGPSDRFTAYKSKGASKPGPVPPMLRNENPWGSNAFGLDSTYGAEDSSPLGTMSTEQDWNTKHDNGKKPKALCKYFQKGFCRFGNKCNFQHVPNGLGPSEMASNGATIDRSNISAQLPSNSVPGFISLNKDGQRIDAYIRPPTQEEWAIYNARFHRQKPCNSHHLQGHCTRFDCPYDHSPLEPESRYCLEYVLKCNPCPRRGACRASDCFYGHLCQKDDCFGKMKGCKMKPEQHTMDPRLASAVPAEDEETLHDEPMAMLDETKPLLW